MPLILGALGILLIIAGARDKTSDLAKLVKGDFTGQNNFIFWVLAIGIVGGIGYVSDLRGLSRWLLALIFIVLIITENKQGHSITGIFTSTVAKITGSAN